MVDTAVALIADLGWMMLIAIVIGLACAAIVEFGAESMVQRRVDRLRRSAVQRRRS